MDNKDIAKIPGETLRDLLYILKDFGYKISPLIIHDTPVADKFRVQKDGNPIQVIAHAKDPHFTVEHKDGLFKMKFHAGKIKLVEGVKMAILSAQYNEVSFIA